MIDNATVRAATDSMERVIVAPACRLDLGCGDSKREGFIGVDFVKTPSVDVVHDLFTFPWPFADSSVDEAVMSHFFEHVPARVRPRFMDELWRILKPGATVQIITPDGNSNRAVQDFTHEWPPIVQESYLYFGKTWREQNRLTHGHYEMVCNFEPVAVGVAYHPNVALRNPEFQQFACTHYINSVMDLHMTLKAIK